MATEVVSQSTSLWIAGLELYESHMDKTYSMTDCISMVVCRRRRIRQVLTADRDFERGGFEILL
jgi:predicted nucleic acid-binding protein